MTKNKKSKIIIVGSGAIGRGYLPWILPNAIYDFVFVDNNKNIIDLMLKQKRYATFKTIPTGLEPLSVETKFAYTNHTFNIEEHPEAVACFINVGPRSVVEAEALLKNFSGPVILCENDPATVELVKQNTPLENVFFGIPDVITSNTAPSELIEVDPLAITTEDGKLFIDSRVNGIEGTFTLLDYRQLIDVQWAAKLYLHNTPHCIAAFLGALYNVNYLHEAVAIPEIEEIVKGSMDEMLKTLEKTHTLDRKFLNWYADKELSRFANKNLYDPISRVARDPYRKLAKGGRLQGAADMCIDSEIHPKNILLGIGAALLYKDEGGYDAELEAVRKILKPATFASLAMGLKKNDVLSELVNTQMESILEKLHQMILGRVVSSVEEEKRALVNR